MKFIDGLPDWNNDGVRDAFDMTIDYMVACGFDDDNNKNGLFGGRDDDDDSDDDD